MRLIRTDEPGPGSRRAVWAGEACPSVHLLGVWTEKRAGLGEDAEPTLLLDRRSLDGIIGVYDGMGGAGARVLGRTADGRSISSAFVASRLAHLAVREWYVEGPREVTLGERLREVFDDARPPGVLKVRGTITKQLPTTMATIAFELHRGSGVRATARWAGDSRCYLLTRDRGLQQISRDDSEVDDPLETLMADQPLTNHVAAGRPFRVNEHVEVRPRAGVLLLCATDGFFGYVESPALFEYHLLKALADARSPQEWGSRLAEWRHRTAGDDATLALAALGFPDFFAIQDAFRGRLKRLQHEHADDLSRLDAAGLDDGERRRRLEEYRAASWERYRDAYMELMPGRAT